MRTSQTLLATEKETPNDAQLVSHKLMLRAGLIRKLASGLYMWLPTGLRVLQKVENIVREEMNKAGAVELLMPHIVPAELWHETGRWDKYGNLLLRIEDRHENEFCYGPTHEESFTELARKEIRSYKQTPLTLYQIQSKFRDEIRPRYGVMRAREFVMKDAYSFHTSQACLENTYEQMYQAYCNVFDRLGLKYRAVDADSGEMGGSQSHEFQILADAGEDSLFYSDASDYAANVEKATCLAPQQERPAPSQELEKFATPGQRTIQDLADNHNIPATQSIKTLVVKNGDGEFFALILRGDHELNEIKAAKLEQLQGEMQFASDEEIRKLFNASAGSLGVVNCPIPLIVDRDAAVLADFVCGANEDDQHYKGVNWERDVPEFSVADLRNVVVGDPSPDGKGTLHMAKGVEVGHIFQLGEKYSSSMNATVLDENGKAVNLIMGCYGLGVSRVIAGAIEQSHDENGIIWPEAMAPFDVVIVPMKYHKSEAVRDATDTLYQELQQAGLDVLLDDRNERPGVMFAESELLGIPHRIVIGERGLENGVVEYKARIENDKQELPLSEVQAFLLSKKG